MLGKASKREYEFQVRSMSYPGGHVRFTANPANAEALAAVDPGGWLRKLEPAGSLVFLGGLIWRVAFNSNGIAAAMIGVGVVLQIATQIILRSRLIGWWASAQQTQPADVALPLTVNANAVTVRLRRSIGWFVLLISVPPAVVLAADAFGNPTRAFHTWQLAGFAVWTLSCWAIAALCLLKGYRAITLSDGSFSVGKHKVALTSQATCSFTKGSSLPGTPSVEIHWGDESVVFNPTTYYSDVVTSSGYGNGSQLIQALAARCHGGDALAWLMCAFPVLPVSYPEKTALGCVLSPSQPWCFLACLWFCSSAWCFCVPDEAHGRGVVFAYTIGISFPVA